MSDSRYGVPCAGAEPLSNAAVSVNSLKVSESGVRTFFSPSLSLSSLSSLGLESTPSVSLSLASSRADLATTRALRFI